MVCEVRPQKEDPNRTRITIGGNRICYPGDTGTKTGSLEVVKLLFNGILSQPNAKFACFDIKNFNLGTPLNQPEYIHINLMDIPAEFTTEYNLHSFVHDGWIYFEITKAIYGLKQASKLANDLLTDHLGSHGYFLTAMTPGLWRHKWHSIMFILIVDDLALSSVNNNTLTTSLLPCNLTTPSQLIGQEPSLRELTSRGTMPSAPVASSCPAPSTKFD